jgi:hypothetical protein
MELNYYQTLIAVADDSPVTASEVPTARGSKPSVATMQFDMLHEHPYEHTQEDVLFEVWLGRQELPRRPAAAEVDRMRTEFLAKPQPCLRSSPLPKRYGWGLLFNADGQIALCPMESADYRRIVGSASPKVKILKALRSKRA